MIYSIRRRKLFPRLYGAYFCERRVCKTVRRVFRRRKTVIEMKYPIYLTSRTNQTVKEFSRMAQSPDSGFFLVEGKHFVADLEPSLLRAVLISNEEKYAKETDAFIKKGVPVYIITEPIAEKISSTKNAQEIMAFTAKQSRPRPDRLLLLDRIQDPGNMGTMIRSAVAFGFGVIYSDGSANPFSAKSVRSSAGTLQKCYLEKADVASAASALRDEGFSVFSAELDRKAITPDKIENTEKIAFIIGNESTGVSKEASDAASGKVFVPICSEAESLNAAAAATVLMWQFGKTD